MPNHIHGIIYIVGAGLSPALVPVQDSNHLETSQTIGHIVGAYKSLCIKHILRHAKSHELEGHIGKIWQRNYYEHIIRHENALCRIREYICENPLKWEFDQYYLKEKSSSSVWKSGRPQGSPLRKSPL